MAFKHYYGGLGEVCKDCERRRPACHDTCEKYQTAKQKDDARKQMIRQRRNEDMAYYLYRYDKVTKELKNR